MSKVSTRGCVKGKEPVQGKMEATMWAGGRQTFVMGEVPSCIWKGSFMRVSGARGSVLGGEPIHGQMAATMWAGGRQTIGTGKEP
jgi:hypothetical protein